MMDRRIFMRGALAGAAALVYGCGGSGDIESEIDGGSGVEEGVHRWGIAMLPDAAPTSPVLLALNNAPGFTVQVLLGAQPQGGVAVAVYDAQDALIDSGTTDSAGVFQSSATGRHFLYAVAQSSAGALVGFEFNPLGDAGTLTTVNLLPTVAHRLYKHLEAHGKSVDFVIEQYFGLRLDSDLSDIGVRTGRFDQDLLRQDWEASGLTLTAYIDRCVQAVLDEVNTGFPEEAPPSRAKGQHGAGAGMLSTLQACVPVPYEWNDTPIAVPQDSIFNADDPVLEYVRRNWSAELKNLLEFGLGKGAEAASGPAGMVISVVGSRVLDAIFPSRNPVKAAFDKFQDQFQAALNAAVEKIVNAIQEESFTAAHKEIKDYFERFDQQLRNIRARNEDYAALKKANKVTPEETAHFNKAILEYSEKLIALEDNLSTCHQLLFGSGAYGTVDSVLKKWFRFRSGDIYTSDLQAEYMDLLNHFAMWSMAIHGAIVDAHVAREELTGIPRDRARMRILEKRLQVVLHNLRLVSTDFLLTARQIIDTSNNTSWLGRCNKAELTYLLNYNFVPMLMPGMVEAAMAYKDPNEDCYLLGDPRVSAKVDMRVLTTHFWQLPTKAQVQKTWHDRIRAGMKVDKSFNLMTFKKKYHMPASVLLMTGDEKNSDKNTKPVKFATRTFQEQYSPFGGQPTGQYMVHMYDMNTASFKDWEIINPRSAQYHVFPVAELSQGQVDNYVPWLKFQKVLPQLQRIQ